MIVTSVLVKIPWIKKPVTTPTAMFDRRHLIFWNKRPISVKFKRTPKTPTVKIQYARN